MSKAIVKAECSIVARRYPLGDRGDDLSRREKLPQKRIGSDFRRCRVEHALDFGNNVGWKAADFGMAFDDVFVFGQVDAEGFVLRGETFDPLNVAAELGQRKNG